MAQTLLYHVSALTAVDVDSMDPTVSARYTKAGVKLHDMTSNQAMVCVEASRLERADILKAAVDQIKSTKADLDIDAQVLETVDLLVSAQHAAISLCSITEIDPRLPLSPLPCR